MLSGPQLLQPPQAASLPEGGEIDRADVEDLLANHYDPRYEESMARNFVAYPTSTRWPVTYQGAGSFEVLARQLLAASN